MSTLNWAELVQDAAESGGNFEPLPAGDYDLKVVGVEEKQTSKGKTMFVIKSEVQSGAYAKRLLWDNLVISPESPGAMGIFFRKMAALGLSKEFFGGQPSNAAISQAISGRPFKGRIKQTVYNGQDRNEFVAYAPAAQAGASAPIPGGAPVPAAPVASAPPVPQAAPVAPAAPQYQAPAAPAAPAPAPAAPVEDPWSSAPAAPAAPPAPAQGFSAPPAPPF